MIQHMLAGLKVWFLLFCVLLLFGCGALQQPEEADVEKACYTFYQGGAAGVIAANGSIVVPPEYQWTRVIYDETSEEIVWLLAVQGSKTADASVQEQNEQAAYQYFLFAPDGTLVVQGPDASIHNVYGDIVLNGQGRLFHWGTGEVLYEHVIYGGYSRGAFIAYRRAGNWKGRSLFH